MLDQLIDLYRGTHDITEECAIGDVIYNAYGFCSITNSKYVLVKKAELWRALCFEHVFFREVEELTSSHIDVFCRHVKEFIEPQLIRKGEKYPEKDHMYSYITGIFVCRRAISGKAAEAVKNAGFVKNYLLSIRGYTQMRILAVSSGTVGITEKNALCGIIGNGAAKQLVREYRNLFQEGRILKD